jgi:hypothetical protein
VDPASSNSNDTSPALEDEPDPRGRLRGRPVLHRARPDVHKVFAGRERDWIDVEGVIERRRDTLDRELINAELRPLLELNDSTHHLVRMEALFDRV